MTILKAITYRPLKVRGVIDGGITSLMASLNGKYERTAVWNAGGTAWRRIAENYPDAEEGTPEWDAAARNTAGFRTGWKRRLSSNILSFACQYSWPPAGCKGWTGWVKSLMQFNQPRIVERMAYVHCWVYWTAFWCTAQEHFLVIPRFTEVPARGWFVGS